MRFPLNKRILRKSLRISVFSRKDALQTHEIWNPELLCETSFDLKWMEILNWIMRTSEHVLTRSIGRRPSTHGGEFCGLSFRWTSGQYYLQEAESIKMAKSVLLLVLVIYSLSFCTSAAKIDDYLDRCVISKNHKTTPGPEGKAFAGHCQPWSNHSCCTSDTATKIEKDGISFNALISRTCLMRAGNISKKTRVSTSARLAWPHGS